MVMVPGREMTDEELLEARSQSSGMQRASTLDALNAMAAAAPQAAPAPPPEPINVPPMLERPMGTIPEALARPSGEVIHPRDQALIDRFKRSRQASQLAQDQARMDQFNRFQQAGMAAQGQSVVPEMLRRMPEVQVPRTAEGMVLEKFGGSMDAYNKWWNSLPQGMKPRSWDQALGMVSSPEALGVPRKAEPPRPSRQERIDAHMATVPKVREVPSRQDRIDAYMATVPEVREVSRRNETTRKVQAPDGGVKGIRLFDGNPDDGKGLLHPVSGDVFRSSSSGMRMHPVHKEMRQHKGDDYAPLNEGENLPLVAMADGRVTYAKDKSQKPVSTGNRIEVEYGQGDNRFRVRYFHMKDMPKLKAGDSVKRGSTVGLMGNTGIGTGVHLHAELYRWNPKIKDYELHDFDKFLESGGKGSLSDTAYDTKRKAMKGHRHGHSGHAADHAKHSKKDKGAMKKVLSKFGGKMLGKGSYNEWYASRPESKRPGGWPAALKMLEAEGNEFMEAPM